MSGERVGGSAVRCCLADHRLMHSFRRTRSATLNARSLIGEAGGFEQRRYEAGLLAWRRRVLPRFRWLLFPVVAGCIVFLVLGPASKLQFGAGLLAGGLLALYAWVRDEPPEHVRRHGVGAEGERSTARALVPLLTDGWRVAHDVDTGHGNRDHVLVGPGGLFLLDSKKLGGTVEIHGETVHVDRRDDPRDSYDLPRLAAALRSEAARMHDEILSATRTNVWVTAVIVLWSPFPARLVEGNKVVFVHGDELVSWLRTRPRRHNRDTVDVIGQFITVSRDSGAQPGSFAKSPA